MNPAKTLQRRRKAACLTTEASAALQGPRVSTDPRLFKAQVGGTTSGGSVLGTGPTATMLAPTSSQPHGPAPCHAMEENTLEMNLCSRAEPAVLRTQCPWSAEGCPQAAGAATGRRMVPHRESREQVAARTATSVVFRSKGRQSLQQRQSNSIPEKNTIYCRSQS